jgi:hypothetical protein
MLTAVGRVDGFESFATIKEISQGRYKLQDVFLIWCAGPHLDLSDHKSLGEPYGCSTNSSV